MPPVKSRENVLARSGSQQRYGRHRLQGWHIAGTGHHHVGVTGIIAGPLPDTRAGCAMANGRIDVEPLPLRLLSGDDQIDIIVTAQAVIRDRQQAVCVGRQIDAHDVGFFVCDMIDEAGILVGEAIVVLSPDM